MLRPSTTSELDFNWGAAPESTEVLKQLANLPEDEGSKDQAGPENQQIPQGGMLAFKILNI